MENNFIQMAASAEHAVAYMIGPIFKHIIDCMQLYCELMLMALHTHFLPQQQYSRVYALFLVYGWGASFLQFF